MDLTELDNSEPHKLLEEVIQAMGNWLDRCERNELDKSGKDSDIGEEWVLEMILQTELRQLAVQGRVWNMDVSAIEACENQPPRPFTGADASIRRRDFWCFVRQFQDEMEARWLARKGDDEAIARHLRGIDDSGAREDHADRKRSPNAAIVGQSLASSLPDGPAPPNTFYWSGRPATLEPIPWKLLDYLWKNRNARALDAIDVVWGHDSPAFEHDGPLKSALRKVNRALDKLSCPLHVSRKSEYVTLS